MHLNQTTVTHFPMALVLSIMGLTQTDEIRVFPPE